MACRPLGPLGHFEFHVLVPLKATEAVAVESRNSERRARNIVLCEHAGDTNTQDNYDQPQQPIRRLVHSRPPAVAFDLPGRERTPTSAREDLTVDMRGRSQLT